MPSSLRRKEQETNLASDKHQIIIKGARTNNLKNVDVTIPKNKLVVVTGLSGSGKSSITMDTLFAEGQRRYVESLSSYARQFLTRIKKPDVDYIKGISPAIAIEQRVSSDNARSTVGTLTEIYDYLRLLYARIGRTISPVSGAEVKKDSVSDIVDYTMGLTDGAKVIILSPIIKMSSTEWPAYVLRLQQKGFTRVFLGGETHNIEEVLDNIKKLKYKPDAAIVIDRLVIKNDDIELAKRIGDSVELALSESQGLCRVLTDQVERTFSIRFEMDGIQFFEPSIALFNTNNSLGACPVCEGYGSAIGIDPDKVIPNKLKSLFDHAIVAWQGESGKSYQANLVKYAADYDIPIHKPYGELSMNQKQVVWNGKGKLEGILSYFKDLEANSYKIQNRVILSRYRGKTVCPECHGKRLRKEALYVKLDGKDIGELSNMSLEQLFDFFAEIKLTAQEMEIVQRILLELNSRLSTLNELGLGYLSLARPANTLSGGETQRIHLTRLLGSNLTSALYILDEPSIGLHPRDTLSLVKSLKKLRDLGNTVIVVEHEEEVIKQADYIIDMGPEAGINGGEVVFVGDYKDISKAKKGRSLTVDYLTGVRSIPIPERKTIFRNFIRMQNVFLHNLKNINVNIPMNALVCVTGVSGSGKSSLVKGVLYPELLKCVQNDYVEINGNYIEMLKGDINVIKSVEMIDQQPIGRSSRSNPITYVKAYDYIRDLFAAQPAAKLKGFKAKHFSFNVEGGRCDNCNGDGFTIVDMQFLADVTLVCEECKGMRFKNEVLDIKYKDKSIYDILTMDVREAIDFFHDKKEILARIQPFFDIGLDYIKLGQSSSSLSGGEAQRVKLASFLIKDNKQEHNFFIFDEPTTGLHFEDVKKLLNAFQRLIDKGNSVIVVEHNMEVIKCADYVIDLGPVGGEAGGHLIYEGSPDGLVKVENSITGIYLKEKL